MDGLQGGLALIDRVCHPQHVKGGTLSVCTGNGDCHDEVFVGALKRTRVERVGMCMIPGRDRKRGLDLSGWGYTSVLSAAENLIS
jgi:hypothetical protein